MAELKKTAQAVQIEFYQASRNIVMSLYKCFKNTL